MLFSDHVAHDYTRPIVSCCTVCNSTAIELAPVLLENTRRLLQIRYKNVLNVIIEGID